jgi:hypothetical protein
METLGFVAENSSATREEIGCMVEEPETTTLPLRPPLAAEDLPQAAATRARGRKAPAAKARRLPLMHFLLDRFVGVWLCSITWRT